MQKHPWRFTSWISVGVSARRRSGSTGRREKPACFFRARVTPFCRRSASAVVFPLTHDYGFNWAWWLEHSELIITERKDCIQYFHSPQNFPFVCRLCCRCCSFVLFSVSSQFRFNSESRGGCDSVSICICNYNLSILWTQQALLNSESNELKGSWLHPWFSLLKWAADLCLE